MFLGAFDRYFELSGRSRRTEFWSFAIIQTVGYAIGFAILLSGIDLDALTFEAMLQTWGESTSFFVGVLLLVFWWLITIVPGVTVTVRRLHDRNMSGWWYPGFTAMGFVPYINLLSSVAFIILLLLPGSQGENDFGPDPRHAWGNDYAYA